MNSRNVGDERTSLESAIHERVVLMNHDPAWPAAFRAEHDRLLTGLPGKFIEIVHIGSTAVDALRAKPIIDLLAGVPSMADALALDEPLRAHDYTTPVDFNTSLVDRQFYFRHTDGHRTHHLHLVVHGSEAWRRRIRFRDLLRSDQALRERYAALKEALAVRHADDREAYTEAKSAFITGAVE